MKRFLTNLFKNEAGQTELTSTVFILLGVATIIAVLLVIFREQLTEIVEGMFSDFRSGGDVTW